MTIWQPDIASRTGPRYMAIADALAADIRTRQLAPGDRLPTHRDLAYRLGVTVGTITRAYSEAQRRGLIEGEIGRGTFVRGELFARNRVLTPTPIEAGMDLRDLPVALHINFPTDLDVIGENGGVLQGAVSRLAGAEDLAQLFNYQPYGGLPRHRESAAQYLRELGIECAPDRVVISAGAQHAMFVALGAIAEPGDVIATEAMTWPGLRRLADFLRLRVQGLPMDEEGIMPEAFKAACLARKITALYCIPNIHNPTTLITSVNRRRELGEIARQFGVRILEDDVYGFLIDQRPPPLVTFAPELGLFLVSVSKSMTPGLRIGYLAVMGDDLSAFGEAMRSTIYMATPLTAEIASQWMFDGTGDRLAMARRAEYARRQALAARILSGLPVRSLPTAMHLWLDLPDYWPADAFALEARIRGAAVCPTSNFAQARAVPNGVRVSISAPRRLDDLERGLMIIASLYKSRPNRDNDIV